MAGCSSSTKLFVVFPPATANDHVIFGLNSVRPVDQVQDVVYLPASESASETTVKVSSASCIAWRVLTGEQQWQEIMERLQFEFTE